MRSAAVRAASWGPLLLLAAQLQDPAPDGGGLRFLLSDRSEIRGEVSAWSASGIVRLRSAGSGREMALAIEEISRISFAGKESVHPDPAAEQARLVQGGLLSGRILLFEDKTVKLENPAGTFQIHRRHLKALHLGALSGPLPEIKDDQHDVLIHEIEKKVKSDGKEKTVKDLAVEYGRLVSIGPKVAFAVRVPAKAPGAAPSEEPREFERPAVKQIYLVREPSASDVPPGWFAKVILRNGDRFLGVVESLGPERVRLFSHLFGTCELARSQIHSILFVPQARLSVGNILVCDQSGVKELDRHGKTLWEFTTNAQYSWSARKLENGNVLIANTNYNQVLEVRPAGRTGGEIVWRLDQSNYPYDAVRTESGTTLVAEYYANRVVEYDRDRKIVWQCAVNYPISVQRLENGNTLICSNYQVIEVNPESKTIWTANLSGVRPWRAQRLDSGNTLVTDYQRGQVVEITPEHRVVWEKKGLSHPVQAIRLEDGNTLILEQEANRIIEVDPSNPRESVNLITGLNYPQGMSTY
jgi:hypothetical protein